LGGNGVEWFDGRTGLTRSQLLRRGGVAGLALLGAEGGVSTFGGAAEALAADLASAPSPARTFVSRRDLRPPRLTIRHPARGAAEGHLFIAPSSGPGQRGVLIFDNDGEPVWFHKTTPVTATDFRASTLKGKPVLTWWEGKYSREGLGRGVYVIVDDSYREIARIRAGGHRDGDLHEFLLTSEGTALVTKNEAVVRDLRAYGGGARSILYGGVVQEIAVPSGRVLFEWRSLDHVALNESYVSANEHHFDYFHINSIDVDADGHLLVSARNTWGVYKIHRRTGAVLWRLGGRKSSFAMGKGTVTAWQHDARSHDGGRLISIFDNGAAPQVQTQSRIVLVRLDFERMRATLEKSFKHRPNRLISKFMGNGQILPDGGAVAGWGSEPFVTEFAPSGEIRFEAVLPRGGQNYRAYRFPWKGRPAAPPRLAAGIAGGKRGLFASWNGSTEVASWLLRYGPSAGDLQDGQVTPRTGFETYLGRPAGTRFASAIALDRNGKALGRSRVQRL
jgi:hypothetical protein